MSIDCGKFEKEFNEIKSKLDSVQETVDTLKKEKKDFVKNISQAINAGGQCYANPGSFIIDNIKRGVVYFSYKSSFRGDSDVYHSESIPLKYCESAFSVRTYLEDKEKRNREIKQKKLEKIREQQHAEAVEKERRTYEELKKKFEG